MIKTSDDSNEAHMAFPSSNPRWNQNFVNGEYVVAFELNPGLHPKIRSMLPKVCKITHEIRM